MDCQDDPGTDGETAADGIPSAGSFDRKLAGIDLNLLIALDALLICRNVTHAARRIGQTQPAMSRSLARLRDLLGDDILVRSSTGLKLTARGEYLAEIVPAAMSHVRDVVSARQAVLDTRLTVSANLMPAVLPHLLQRSGNETLKISTHKSINEGSTQLRSRTAQLMLGAVPDGEPDLRSETIVTEDFVTLVALRRHSLGGIRPSLEAFVDLQHVNLVENGTELFPQFSEALMGCGVRRSRLFEVPDVTSAALMVSEGELALTVPRSIAGWLTKTLPLSPLLPPIDIPDQEIAISWLADAGEAEWRRLIADINLATKEAIAQDQASIRILRPIVSEN